MHIDNDLVMGRTYRDVITGFAGVAVGFAVYLTGCDSVLLVPPAEDDDLPRFKGVKRREGEWFDIDRLGHLEGVPDIQLYGAVATGTHADGESEKETPDDAPPQAAPVFRYRGGDRLPPEHRRRD